MRRLKLLFVCGLILSSQVFAELGEEDAYSEESSVKNSLDQYRPDSVQTPLDRALIAQAVEPSSDGTGTLVPVPKKATESATPTTGSTPKVKKKKKKSDSALSTEEGAVSVGHEGQDNGAPYRAEVDFDFWYSSQTSTYKYTDTSYKHSDTEISLNLSYFFIFGRFEAGPKLGYLSSTSKEDTGASTSIETKDSGMSLGAGFVFNFANIQSDKMVPFLGLDIDRYTLTSTTTPESRTSADSSSQSKSTYSDLRPSLSLGVKYFVGAHVALKTMLQYQTIMNGEVKTSSTNTEEAVATVSGSKLKLGVGIATFF